jgi:hypothetical protein
LLRQLALLLAETGIATENQRPLFHMKVYRIANQKNTTENKLNTCNRLQILDRISLNTHQTQTNEKRTIHETNARYTNERNETNELYGKRKRTNARYTKRTNDTRNERTIHERTNHWSLCNHILSNDKRFWFYRSTI